MAFEDAKVHFCDDNLFRSLKRDEMKRNSRSEYRVKRIRVFTNIKVMQMKERCVADVKGLAGALSCDGHDAINARS